MPESPRDEIQRLRAAVLRHEELYRKKHAPEISDYEFDQLKDRLQELESAHPELAGPDLGIGDDRSEGFVQREHAEPMLSLDNTYDAAQFAAFVDRLAARLPGEDLALVVEPKVDGVAISLTYEHGVLARAVTRGNGFKGDDVTANIGLIADLPRKLKGAPALLEVRGEVYMETAEFARLNAEREAAGEPLYANPRNLAAGTVKLLDREEAARRRLSIVCYGLGACQPAAFKSLKEFNARLKAWGFPTSDLFTVATGKDAALAAIERLDSARRGLPYPTDGAVAKLDRLDLQARAGATSKFPHWAVAFKFPPDQAETLLRAISMQVGRTGVITPVAELEPVLLAGTTVSRATLHNADEIARKDIREGDTVRIQKAGEIIPQVLGVVKEKRPRDATPFDFEGRLRELGLDAARDEGEAAYKLRAPSREMKIRRLVHFASKHCLDIDGLGDAVAEQLVDLGLVDAPTDALSLNAAHWALLDKFKEKSVENMLAALEAAKSRELWRAIHALGIPNVGMQTAKDLAEYVNSIETLSRLKLEDLVIYENVEGGENKAHSVVANIGEIAARSIVSFIQSPEGRHEISALSRYLTRTESQNAYGYEYFNSLGTHELKLIRLKALKAGRTGYVQDTILSLCVPKIGLKQAAKIVSYGRDLMATANADPIDVCRAIHATKSTASVSELFRRLKDRSTHDVIVNAGAPLNASQQEYEGCIDSCQNEPRKILLLFGHSDAESLDVATAWAKVRQVLQTPTNLPRSIGRTAYELWQKQSGTSLFELNIHAVPFGAALALMPEAEKLCSNELENILKLFDHDADGIDVKEAVRELLKQVTDNDGKKRPSDYRIALSLWEREHGTSVLLAKPEDISQGGALKHIEAARSPDGAKFSRTKRTNTFRRPKLASAGNVIVISGKVEGLNREEAKAKAESLGYQVMDSVTGSINMLVVGDDPGPSKVKKAEKLGIKVIPFSELTKFEA